MEGEGNRAKPEDGNWRAFVNGHVEKKGDTRTKVPLTAFIWPMLALVFSGYHLFVGTQSVSSFVTNIIIFVIGVGLFTLLTLARLVTGKDPAARIAAQQRQLFGGGPHTFRPADESDFRGLDRVFYDAARSDLTTDGFQTVGDVVDVTAANSWPRHRCVLRRFVSRDGSTMASAYHVKLLGPVAVLQLLGVVSRKLKIYECETELTDGTFVTTSNDAKANRTSGYPFVDRLQFGPDTPLREIVQRHREHIQAVIQVRDSGVVPFPIKTAKEYQASQDRMQQLKSAYRRSPNFDFRTELESIRGRGLGEHEREFADDVVARLKDAASPEQAERG